MLKGMKSSAAIALSAAFLAGCVGERVAGGTGVGNPAKGSVTVSMQASAGGNALAKASAPRNPDGSFTITDAGGTPFTVRESFANVGRIKLQLPEGLDCKDADESACESLQVEIPGPMVADLMTGKWLPDPGAIRIPIGSYRRIDVRLESQSKDSEGTPSILAGHSMILRGSFDYAGSKDKAFSIALDFGEDARFDSDSGLVIDSIGVNRLLVLLDVEKWLSGVDITRCLDEGRLALLPDGSLVVDKENACGQLENDLKSAIKASGRLGKGKE
ncbi:MAG: hypothetical protein JWP91_1080 [Fibrobacteres bacterium]|nr:hypothetical protein [Fibrobacterota bacterium]